VQVGRNFRDVFLGGEKGADLECPTDSGRAVNSHVAAPAQTTAESRGGRSPSQSRAAVRLNWQSSPVFSGRPAPAQGTLGAVSGGKVNCVNSASGWKRARLAGKP